MMSGGMSVVASIVTFIVGLIAAIFYFLVFLPSQKQKKQQQAMLDSLQAGNEVVTTGGIVGTVVTTNPDTIIIRINPDNVKLQVARSAVASLIKPEDPDSAKKS